MNSTEFTPELLDASRTFLALDQDFRQYDKGIKPESYQAWLNENTEARRILIDVIAKAENASDPQGADSVPDASKSAPVSE